MEIKIDIESKLAFTKVAYVLDWSKCLKYISDIRRCWLKDNNLIPYEQAEAWIIDYHPTLTYTKETASYLGEIQDRYEIDKLRGNLTPSEELTGEDDQAKLTVIDYEVECLVKRLGLPANWTTLMTKAIISGEVKQLDYDNLLKSENNFLYHDWLFDASAYKPLTKRVYLGETKSSIKLHREWYWLNHTSNKNRLGLRKLENQFNIPLSTINDGITAYRNFLNEN